MMNSRGRIKVGGKANHWPDKKEKQRKKNKRRFAPEYY
jgi:hypothetical protein